MIKKTIGFLTDRKLTQRIRERIRWDKRVSTSDLQFVVRAGHIVLMGTVDSPFRKQAALEIVTNTDGVVSVDDQVIVPFDFYRSDSEFKKLIEDQIVSSGVAPTERISVEVTDAHVKLDGIVHSARKKAQAAGIVWELSGVQDCINMIEIVEPPQANARAEENRARAQVFSSNDFLSCRQGRVAI